MIMSRSPQLHHTSELKPIWHVLFVRTPLQSSDWCSLVLSTGEIAKPIRFENLLWAYGHFFATLEAHAMAEFVDSKLDVLSEEESIRDRVDLCASSIADAANPDGVRCALQ